MPGWSGGSKRHRWWWIPLLGVLAVTGSMGLTACAGDPGRSPSTSSQGDYVLSVLHDRSYLFDGYVVVASSLRIPVDDTYRLLVRVCGSRASCGVVESAKPTAVAGRPVVPPTATPGPGEAVIKVGGMISGRLTSDMPGTIAALTSPQQPVLTPDDQAQWLWDLTPTQPGSYTLVLHLTVLRGQTSQPLLADQTIEIPLIVSATAAHTARVAWLGVKEILALLSAAGVSLIAVAGFVVRRLRRRRGQRYVGVSAGHPAVDGEANASPGGPHPADEAGPPSPTRHPAE